MAALSISTQPCLRVNFVMGVGMGVGMGVVGLLALTYYSTLVGAPRALYSDRGQGQHTGQQTCIQAPEVSPDHSLDGHTGELAAPHELGRAGEEVEAAQSLHAHRGSLHQLRSNVHFL